ncbi:unnamed protein product [Acanthoscelides obtectus]|uniref:CCHC-type domain-containing protein n=1 Tax=Acanthoscelides obtectus TaxID=200917 RepID=A0A9P0M5N5_ACAOB|nr:unnamed protein product [Acanthoscelides obtectus]CAK1682349.1 Nucleic-acid-binding protein from transposon X-element [Acanthoscelides obtectus]
MAGTGVPPINIEGTADWSSLSRMMNSKGIQFSKARTAGTSVKVFTNTPADYRQLVALLESIKRPFFTYQLKEDRMDQRVIRGLPREMSVNDIKEDLVSQGIADAVVQQLTSRTTKKPLPLFLVKTKMPEKLAEIQRLAMLTVSFERKKKSSEPSQCYRCQRYGHTQRNCRLAERMMNSKGIQFSKARTAGTSVKVFTNTPADYRQLVALLESIKRPFFTYQLKEDRMDQRVIRGLPREMSVNDIKEDLVSQGIADAVVQQLTSRTTKKPLPLFLVKTKMPEKLAEIQRLAMLTVSFERKKKSSEPSQCYRCQRYGHTQRNCRLAERATDLYSMEEYPLALVILTLEIWKIIIS